MVYYRKYRPQKISELDLPSVREKLANILASKELPHAFLFTGSKGLGKTSSARILAKAINCTNREIGDGSKKSAGKDTISKLQSPNSEIEPCNSCDICTSITNGSNIDVLEIDAASNGGVEEIRSLRERVKFASATLKYKVYIIDEVHMLSTGAFNALLKTLEEPPSHVIFILATTELWKLPSTVVSRTFQVLFEKPTPEQIVGSLRRIVSGEELEVEDGVLEKVALLSGGAFRDGAKILEELSLASKGRKITLELFDQTFKTMGIEDEVGKLLDAYSIRDAKAALEVINRMTVNGADFHVVFGRLVDHLRGLLMMRNGIESQEEDISNLSLNDIKTLLELANEAYGELRLSIIPQLPLELMTVKYCILDAADQMTVEERSQKSDIKNQILVPPTVTASETKQSSSNGKKIGDGREKTEDKSQNSVLSDLVGAVNELNKPAGAVLRSCKSATIEGDVMTIITPFPMHEKIIKSDRVLADIKKAAKELFNTTEVTVKVVPQ